MPKRILIVDDAPHTRQILRFMLENRGYELVEAGDGEEALEKVKSHSPDLIVLDGMMPKKSGLEVAHELRQNPETSRLPIIAVSAINPDGEHSMDHYRLKALADQYVEKPFKVHDLVNRIASLLDAPRPAEERKSPGTQTRRRMGTPF